MKKRETSVLVKPTEAGKPEVDKALDDLRKQVSGREFADGAKLLPDVVLESGLNRFAHGLGKRPQGYIVTSWREVTATQQMIFPAAVMQPVAEGNWLTPNGTNDFWESAADIELIHIPLAGMLVGSVITGMELIFFANAAANPTVNFYVAGLSAGGNLVTPTVAWTAPGTTVWVKLTASYSETVAAGNAYVTVNCPTTGDCVRNLTVTYTSAAAPVGPLDESADHTDADTFMYLRTDGYAATVDLLLF